MEGYYPQLVLPGPLQHASLQELLPWGLAPTVSRSFFWAGSSPADINGPTSIAIYASCLVGDDSGNCPTSSSLLASSLHLSILPGVGGPLVSSGSMAIPVPEPLAVLGLLFLSWPITHPHISRCDLGLYHSGMENQSIRGLGRLFKRCAPFLVSLNKYRSFEDYFTNGRQVELYFTHF